MKTFVQDLNIHFRLAKPLGRQRGAVAIFIALTIAVMLGFAGLALDLGRLYVNKSELQSAADACALAASRELTCDVSAGPCGASYLQNAENAGLTAGNRNQRNFQSGSAAITPADILFSTTLSPNANYLSIAAGAPPASRFVMCVTQQTGIVPWFMQILGVGNQTVNAQAVATLAPSQTACAVPMGICAASPGDSDYGMEVGRWYSGKFGPPGGPPPAPVPPGCEVIETACNGSFNWIDFTPPSGGANELKAMLAGQGACELPPAGTPVGESGAIASLGQPWNTRFGMYQGSYNGPNKFTEYPPDHSGYAYTPFSWPSCQNALANYQSVGGRRSSNTPYGTNVANGNTLSGLSIGNAFNPVTQAANLAIYGRDRRMAIAPIVNCADWCAGTGNTTPVLNYACIFMLHPVDGVQGVVRAEYHGLASDAGSPCATSGVVGGNNGPLVPSLVQ
jgi:Flp pilus assembly protein TadG